MDYLIEKYTQLTVEDIEIDLSDIYNVFIMFSVFFVFFLLEFIFREADKKLTIFKNRKKSDKISTSNFEECSKCGVFSDIDQMVLRDGKYICKECIKGER